MKTFITALVLTFLAFEAFAGCTVNFEEPGTMGMGMGFTGKKSYNKIVRILEAKGYEVKSDRASRQSADYVLEVNTDWGYDCGTGLTWVDYLVLPAGYEVRLSMNHGNEIFYRAGDLRFPIVGVKSLARAKLYRAVRAIPSCQ